MSLPSIKAAHQFWHQAPVFQFPVGSSTGSAAAAELGLPVDRSSACIGRKQACQGQWQLRGVEEGARVLNGGLEWLQPDGLGWQGPCLGCFLC